jgi:ectoine hydroxylase-related dioxygenase (phytanoyl-CoA dioxygenase family)
MHFIPLTEHQALFPHRPFYPNDYASMMTDHVDLAQAIACPLRTGDASVHGPLTLHAALANKTASIRRTWTITFTP